MTPGPDWVFISRLELWRNRQWLSRITANQDCQYDQNLSGWWVRDNSKTLTELCLAGFKFDRC